MADPTTRLAILAAVCSLVGCAHAGRGAAGRAVGAERAQPQVPSEEAGAVPEPPPTAAPAPVLAPRPAAVDPELEELRAQAREAEAAVLRARARVAGRPVEAGRPAAATPDPASAVATAEVPAAPRPTRNGVVGALKGAGYAVGIWFRVCVSHPLVALVCIAGFPYYWGAAVGAVVVGGAIGAAIEVDGSAPVDRDRPGPRRGRSTTSRRPRRGVARPRRPFAAGPRRSTAAGPRRSTAAGPRRSTAAGPRRSTAAGPRRPLPPRVHSAA